MLRLAASRLAAPARATAMPTLAALRPAARRTMATMYTREHEYVKIDGNEATCGVSDHAQNQLGDVVYVGLPDVGDEFEAGDAAASVESVKAASDVYAPVSGTVTAVNEALNDNPGLVNESAEGDGWFFKLEVSDPDTEHLIAEADYAAYCEEDAH